MLARVQLTAQRRLTLRLSNTPLPQSPLVPFPDDFKLRGEQRLIKLEVGTTESTDSENFPVPLGTYRLQDASLRLYSAQVVDRYGSGPSLLEGLTPESGVTILAVVDGWVCGEVSLQHQHGALTGTFAAPIANAPKE
jgi:hypothetical protein